MSRETYETYSAEPEKIDLIAFLAEYFQAFRKFFLGVLILVILMGGGSFLTAKLRYQPMYEAYTSFVVGSNRAVGYSYYDNVTAQQLGKTFPYIVTSGVLKDVVARDLQVGAVTSQIEDTTMMPPCWISLLTYQRLSNLTGTSRIFCQKFWLLDKQPAI